MADPDLKITDVCLLVEDIQRAVDFYTKVLGFRLRRRAEGFADFHSDGVTLAAWELDHINRHCGVSNVRAPSKAHKACIGFPCDGLPCGNEAGTAWSPYWCFDCNVKRIDSISASLENIVESTSPIQREKK